MGTRFTDSQLIDSGRLGNGSNDRGPQTRAVFGKNQLDRASTLLAKQLLEPR
eukprot:CAMPEP_0205858564 /NCGR_PEP_ID=MMETSP1083-20121108/4266_1 /ASSEMBLY_ACC=CAM_ASM_000430 /TAXON_ID=97485 /ORGANISM="Prymnesium parvum, Strain Texoma1" /LENGTH=51 /DNA_ID=CAMNT_0053220135 /DNA_START=70 /DNA_END=221 /DNA_ORIENTATION=-